MLCESLLSLLNLGVGYIGRYTKVRQLIYTSRYLNRTSSLTYLWNWKFGRTGTMMVYCGSVSKGPTVDALPKKDDDGSYASGGWKRSHFCSVCVCSFCGGLCVKGTQMGFWQKLGEREDGRLSCGYSSFRGKRASMEDFFDVKASLIHGEPVCLFGIFDGHGGSRAAEYLKGHLFENLIKHPEFIARPKFAISDTYQQTDRDFLESEKDTSRDDGSTASTAVLVGNRLYVANVGDSRTIISKAGKAIPLSEDHKPNRSDERKRIESAGGVVMWAGTWRVGGVLAMSRAFGNRMLKQFVVAEPEIQEQEVDQDLELLVLASDGLWDVVPNEDAVSIAQSEEEPEAAARKLTETAFTRGSADNITCIVVKFHHERVGSEDNGKHVEAKPLHTATQEHDLVTPEFEGNQDQPVVPPRCVATRDHPFVTPQYEELQKNLEPEPQDRREYENVWTPPASA